MTTYINDINSAGEWARLDHQARLVDKATGLLPALFDEAEFPTILDVGCGPGHWVLEMAAERPEAAVYGIDVSRDLIDYATARARTQQLNNAFFRVHDFLANELPFAEGSFDLIHVRFAVSWVKETWWLLFLQRCHTLLRPQGYIVLTEGEGIYTTSLALERLHAILCEAFFASGYGLSHSPHFIGVVARLGSLLTQIGFEAIQIAASVLDFSFYNQEANMAWRESFHALISEAASFLLQSGMTTAEELAQIDQQMLIDLFQDEFGGIGNLFTFSAQKLEKQRIYE